MNKRFFALSLVPLYLASTASADVISIRADIWCPYNCAPKSDKPGYLIEILQETLGKKGHTIDYQELNWARAIEETRKNKFVAIVGASKTDAPDFIFPATPMGKGTTCFYVQPKSTWKYEGVKSLENISIGVIRDYSYDSDVVDAYIKENEKNAKRVDIVSGDNPLGRNLQKLKMGRITAILEDSSVFSFELSKQKEKIEYKNAGCVKDAPIYAAFSPANKNSQTYAKIVTDGLSEMRKNGKLQSILNKYGLQDDFGK